MKNLNTSLNRGNSESLAQKSGQVERVDSTAVVETVKGVNETVNTLNESGEGGAVGQISEKSKQVGEQGSSAGLSSNTSGAQVAQVPSVDEMVKQTTVAIEVLLQKKETELKAMSTKSRPFEYNNAVREIRFLNDLLGQLKNAAKLAKDFLINIWRQYVKKVG